MAFKFNFEVKEEEQDFLPDNQRSESNQPSSLLDNQPTPHPEFSEIIPKKDQISNLLNQCTTTTVKQGNLCLSKLVITQDQIDKLFSQSGDTTTTPSSSSSSSKKIVVAEAVKHSDLVPKVYEGGFKLWECSLDLVEALSQKRKEEGGRSMEGLKVLELGCGHGMPGIYTAMEGASVHFQDYNHQVIEWCTIPTLALNSPESLPKCRFFAGDWADMKSWVESEGETYDIILAAETLYHQDSHRKFLSVIQSGLAKGGVAYIASKSYYFSCGGGTRDFEALVKEQGMTVQSIKTFEDLQSNIREILEIRNA